MFWLGKGDCLFLYTDGVTEAMNIQNEEFGDDGLQNTLDTSEATTTERLCGAHMGKNGRNASFVQYLVQSVWAYYLFVY